MRLGVGICVAIMVVGSLWVAGTQWKGDDSPPTPKVQAFADCLSASGVAKAEPTSDTYYGAEGRVFVPGGEVFVFASQQEAEGSITQIEADNASPQLVAGTVPIVGVAMADQGGPFPMTETSHCAYSGSPSS